MTTPVKYKKPRRINAVSITLAFVLLVAGYAAYMYLPLYFLQHEAYRVLEETGSKLSNRARFYTDDGPAREELRRKMQRQIKDVGVQDPNIETWIEFEGKEVRVGVLYSAWVEWPFDVIEKQESIYELEHKIIVK